MKNVIYFCNWSIYARKHLPWEIPCSSTTHIIYAFANCDPLTGEVQLSDKWADEQIVFENDKWTDDSEKQLHGCFYQFNLLKRQHRQLKLFLSIGGYSFAGNFAEMAKDETKRKRFAESAAQHVINLGLDGIDLDWEYADTDEKAQQYVELLRAVRLELDSVALKTGLDRHTFGLSIAAPGSVWYAKHLKIAEMDQFLSFWNIMAYDFAGSWSPQSGHQSNLYGGEISVDQIMNYYVQNGVASEKLILGMPIYGRSFAGTDGLNKPYTSVGEGTQEEGSWERGVWDYKKLPRPGFEAHFDDQCKASYLYNKDTKTLVTYDDVNVVKLKSEYVRQKNLGGGMWWESSADGAGDQSLILNFVEGLHLDKEENCLHYPQSEWRNINN
ncbi:glycoside hydrolase [Yarrowia lipolytica]|uniref:chitinase n=2 Tax=Yarrowia lipolytica TaxID=4952 RepID=Q6C2W7_YARLI|nr:YALI0F04532p [Yarrowia lipolytica CLIB122]AOW06657.1 hypothetical protein YALI1_F06904g [Yarrowia lipolytica]KAB8284768.1 glycoside hydrolase [Yarrowia lipolytica]KAE8174814.1 glycoside hydrolase [Yarrowia lipolytica]KAJ8056121.1 glycoside hydrolase [Yarrowia lipolytica]QNQ00542.1 Endochitinase B1 [Yarrowia lipolytica]|eukprot:XP_504995.1 YALI0F04532p [Yarrowia lipolytica CLIB122]